MIDGIRQKISISNAVLVRGVVLGGLLFGLLVVGFLAPRIAPELVLASVIAPPLILLSLTRLESGVLIIVLTAGFVRYSLPTGTESRIVISLLITALFIGLWVMYMLVVEKKLFLGPSRTNVPLLGFMLTAIISYGWSNTFRDPLVVVWDTWPFVQLGGLAVMILLPGAFLFAANTISDVRWLQWLCYIMTGIGALSLMNRFVPINLSFVNIGGLFSLWFVSLTYAQALFNKRLSSWLRLILLGLAGSWMYIYFIARVTWLSGWVPPVAALGTISLLKSKKLFLVILLVLAVYVGLNWEYYTDTVLEREVAESGQTRLAAWEQNWRVTGKHLLFGTGPAGYAAYYMSYFPTEAMATHSNYVDIVSQTGIVGLFFSLWFFAALGWTGYELHTQLKGSGNFAEGFAAATLAGWVGCMLAMGLGDWMFPFVYTQTITGFDYAVYSWILLGGMLALSHICCAGRVTKVNDD